MTIDTLSDWAAIKGVNLLGTGDFTHPDWLTEIKQKLEALEYGLYKNKNILYILTAEVSNIYSKQNRVRKIHNIIFAPDFNVVEEINKMLGSYGSLFADGRPILKLECDKMVKNLRKINKDIFVVPAHAWTPHFGVFGANSGFDSIEECYEDETQYIYALETGLSSDPAMNWRWSALDEFSLLSNSDAHSPSKIGREANIFKEKFGYKELIDILKKKDKEKFLYTIEFYPEEGKYHWDGHRKCSVSIAPSESRNLNNKCPKCGKPLTIGVLHRVESLGDRREGFVPLKAHPYKSLVPLVEIIASALDAGSGTKGVERQYREIISKFGSEFKILVEIPDKDIRKECPENIAQGILNARNGNVNIKPGSDGVYGKVNVFKNGKIKKAKQVELF
ncbi:MAG: DNA helicase UvrD [Candidatus Omnitrophica bacterium]|nr:DNA helicase UvrD [Candidatus Omnitrophota bacterium]